MCLGIIPRLGKMAGCRKEFPTKWYDFCFSTPVIKKSYHILGMFLQGGLSNSFLAPFFYVVLRKLCHHNGNQG